MNKVNLKKTKHIKTNESMSKNLGRIVWRYLSPPASVDAGGLEPPKVALVQLSGPSDFRTLFFAAWVVKWARLFVKDTQEFFTPWSQRAIPV